MTFFFHDIAGLLLGSLTIPVIGLLPGFALLRGLERWGGLRAGTGWERFGWALLLAFAAIPVLDASMIRLAGVGAALFLRIGAALIALPDVVRWARAVRRPPRSLIALAALWWLAVAVAFVDVDWAGGLYQSLVIVDLVKHAAVVETIALHGLPLRDAFFARAEPAGYYFYYYTLPAELHYAMGRLVDARMAFAASLLWVGLAVPALIYRIGSAANLIRPGRDERFLVTATWLCFVAGAGLPCALLETAFDGKIAPQMELWTDEVRFALTSVIWVPHHMSALIACWVGALFLCMAKDGGRRSDGLVAAMAGLCFASAFGLSVWITLTALPIFACWAAIRLFRRDYRSVGLLIAAGVFALLLSLPQMRDILHGRSDSGLPVALSVRRFTYWDLAAAPTDPTLIGFLIFTLPFAYAVQFGYFAAGFRLFLRLGQGHPRGNSVRLLLMVGTIISLIVASFVCSTIINNDLGWRSIWFAQLAAMVGTTAALHALPARTAYRNGLGVLLAIGLLGNVYDFVGFRVLRKPYVPARGIPVNGRPVTDLAERQAYEWAAAHLNGDAVIQHNASAQHRIFDFGLYGPHRPAVADVEAQLFGAKRADVLARLEVLWPIFYTALPVAELQERARRQGVDYVLLTDADPAWNLAGGPSFRALCVYRNAHVCLLPTKVATR